MDWNERTIRRVGKGLIFAIFAICELFANQHAMWSNLLEKALATVTSLMAVTLIFQVLYLIQTMSIRRRSFMDQVALCIVLAPVIVFAAFLGIFCLMCGLLFLYFSKIFVGVLFFWTGIFFLAVSLQLLLYELDAMPSSTSPPGLNLTL
ncbi:uncharacterized protein LOC118204375 [Stegodyphus dumicola]|uniref:uncharacterized protein LOC118204375 n=1 Tax=Stegodyphus dumicola TaxID=202533 RepID=UPI0015AE2CAE|nr:uncharacterized protein LOC118204375 [Stegodyphus dumicola]